MALSTLYKNGNSIVVAIPPAILTWTELKAGDQVLLRVTQGEPYGQDPIILISKPTTHEKSKAPSKR